MIKSPNNFSDSQSDSSSLESYLDNVPKITLVMENEQEG
jgi:hypothetical protein